MSQPSCTSTSGERFPGTSFREEEGILAYCTVGQKTPLPPEARCRLGVARMRARPLHEDANAIAQGEKRLFCTFWPVFPAVSRSSAGFCQFQLPSGSPPPALGKPPALPPPHPAQIGNRKFRSALASSPPALPAVTTPRAPSITTSRLPSRRQLPFPRPLRSLHPRPAAHPPSP